MSELNKVDEEFRARLLDEVNRLECFEQWGFMGVGKKEYRNFFERRTRDIAKVRAVMEKAIQLPKFPTPYDLSQIWMDMYPAATREPESPEEKQAVRSSTEEWYAQELVEAAERRKKFLATRQTKCRPVTDAEIIALASGTKTLEDVRAERFGE